METILVVSIFKVTGKWTSQTSLYALLTFDPGLESSHVRENKREQSSHRPSSYQLEDEALVLDKKKNVWFFSRYLVVLKIYVTSNIRMLIRRTKYELIIKLITQIEANSRDESIKHN